MSDPIAGAQIRAANERSSTERLAAALWEIDTFQQKASGRHVPVFTLDAVGPTTHEFYMERARMCRRAGYTLVRQEGEAL